MYESRAIFFYIIQNFSLLILSGLGLHCCTKFSLAVVGGGCSLVTVHRLLTVVATLVVEHRL